ncbi:MAG: Uma2 family endonuclease [Symploca sp. SIO2E6]|nr:Uma2 family endonuclease [Symploca sp. SIO2E6]
MTYTPVKLTFEQYLEYEDSTDNHYELCNGELVEMPPASPLHSDIVEFLDRLFYSEVQRLGLDWKVKRGDVGVQTGFKTARLPDVAVIEGEQWQILRNGASSAVLNVPSLVAVEVVSPYRNQLDENYRRDYVEKKAEYEQLGIPEYWIVDPQAQRVTVLLLVNGSYQATKFNGLQRIVSRTFPELELTAAQVLQAR